MQVQRFHRAQSCRGADKDAEMQRCTDTVVKRCRGGAEEVQRYRSGGTEEVQMCGLQRYRGADTERLKG